jgi:excisionase family DNA binding protein
MDDAELLDIKQAARLLNVTEASLRRWTNSGRLACLRVGARRERRFRRADLLAFLEAEPARGVAEPGHGSSARAFAEGANRLPRGTHLCSMYRSDAARTALAVEWLVDGLEEGSVCFLLASEALAREIVAQLRQRRDLAAAADERLHVGTYRKTREEHVEAMEHAFAKALRGGARSLRVVGDVSSAWFARHESVDYVVAYERDYERMARRIGIVSLCQYDARSLAGQDVCGLLDCHPEVFRYPGQRTVA